MAIATTIFLFLLNILFIQAISRGYGPVPKQESNEIKNMYEDIAMRAILDDPTITTTPEITNENELDVDPSPEESFCVDPFSHFESVMEFVETELIAQGFPDVSKTPEPTPPPKKDAVTITAVQFCTRGQRNCWRRSRCSVCVQRRGRMKNTRICKRYIRYCRRICKVKAGIC